MHAYKAGNNVWEILPFKSVSFRANVVLTIETKTGMSSEADLNVNHGE